MGERYEPEEVRRDLLYLRKGPGYTDQRLLRCPALTQVLGGSREPTHLLRERLESAIRSLRDEDAHLLEAVFALDGRPDGAVTLAQRRQTHGATLGIGRDAVADRDTAAVERLLYQLITGWYPKSPVPTRVPESHNGLVQHHVQVATIVKDRRHVLTHHRYRFWVTFDGAQYITIATAEPAPPVVTAGDFTVRTEAVEAGYLHQFWHHEPLRRGRTYDLGFTIHNQDPNDPYWLTEESLAFHEPTRIATFTVRFDGAQPARIWSFQRLTGTERPGAATSGEPLELSERGETRAEFHDQYGGLYAGIAWEY